ncbi:aldehyde ferredoxin oxidoreductase N-terminal domain-containing protein [Chloroflexota bacterium]
MPHKFGYAEKILWVNLSSGSISSRSTSDYADKFIGGRGVAAKVYWDEVRPEVGALDPENCLILMTGPMAGVRGIAGPRWEVSGKSPATSPEQFCYCNLGGSWGARLKFAGYDGVVVSGRADKPSYLFITDDAVEIRDASSLWGRGAIEVRETLKGELGGSVSMVACGPAGENKVVFANLLADNDASGASGFGAVMGSKNMKAIVVGGNGRIEVANPARLRELSQRISQLKKGVTLPDIGLATGTKMKNEHCYGCPGGCFRAVYKASDGTKGKFMCQSGIFYQELAVRYYGEGGEIPFHANKLCDDYGLDTGAIQPIIIWLSRCYRAGILTDESTGIPLSKLGSYEFVESLVRKISLREDFGDTLAGGVFQAANLVGAGTKELITDYAFKTGFPPHDPRLYITTALLYAMVPRPTPMQFMAMMGFLVDWLKEANGIIEDYYMTTEAIRRVAGRLFGGELAVDFSTYDGKALAAKILQDRESAEASLILCGFSWPITHVRYSDDHVGDPTLESKVLSAVTGKEVGEEELYQVGEAVFNLQRAILAREGHRGREYDTLPEYFFEKPAKPFIAYNPGCLVPGREGEVISRKGAVLDRGKYERMKDEYYGLRGWDIASGLQTRGSLEVLGLSDIANDLEKSGLLAGA